MKKFKKILLGVAISTILTIIFILIFSLILANTSLSEKYIDAIVIVICGACMLVGSTVSTKKIEKNGIIVGVLVAIVYLAILYIISSLVTNNFSINIKTVWMFCVSIILGATGGIIGVNIK